MFSNKLKNTTLIVLFISVSLICDAGNRRHFVLLQDDSGSYYQTSYKSDIGELQRSLCSLFSNAPVSDEYSLLSKEIEQGIPFFDPQKDDISFLWFVADQKGNVEFRNKANGDYRDFENYFFKLPECPTFSQSNLSVNNFLRINFSNRPAIQSQANNLGLYTYSFTAFSYPLCLDVIQTNYSEEYIFIIISDFKAGSTFGNKKDEKIFKDAFHQKAKKIIDRVNWLNAQFFTVDYFNYYITTSDGSMIGYTAFKAKPNAGYPNPENIDVRLNSDIQFKQKTYGDDIYTLKSTEVVFKHSEALTVDKIAIEVTSQSGIIAKSETNKIRQKDGVYSIPDIQNFKLSGLFDNGANFNYRIKFIFYTTYTLSNGQDANLSALKYTFNTSRSISRSNFILLTKLTPVQTGLLIALIVVIVIMTITLILLKKGKPLGILLRFNHFNDSYETIDFTPEGSGMVHTDYKYWTDLDESNGGFEIKVEGRLNYLKRGKFYNWKEDTGYTIRIYPKLSKVPTGFDVYVSGSNKISNTDTQPIDLSEAFKDKIFKFSFKFRKNPNVEITEPIRFEVGAELHCSNNGLRSFELEQKIQYDFHVGPNLDNIWLGIDPGTTGSCIAVATERDNLVIEKDSDGKDAISPSVILIKSDCIKDYASDEDRKEGIRKSTLFGAKADAIRGDRAQNKFVSIKKLLGYNEKFILGKTPHGDDFVVDSAFLSTLLIEGLLNQQKEFITNGLSEYPQFARMGKFTPQRAAVAIPNNFTASKIQQLKNCIMDVKNLTIKEVRFIYEAESILVNYINSQKSNEKQQESVSGENVFIYDMGGATINATLANVKRRLKNHSWVYEIEILSKLGYGIGGDTIDYAYLQWIFSKKDSFHDLAVNNPFVQGNAVSMAERRKLKDEVLKLKKATIANYSAGKDTLIDRYDIINFNGFNLDMLDEKADPFITECKNDSSSFLYNQIFEKFIWNNVSSIVDDVMSICERKGIRSLDTVIMSGRSSHFPRVKEIVENTINKKYKPVLILLSLEESKSAVAKGACYYGTQNNSIELKNRTVNGVFGVIQTLSPTDSPRFIRLISDGTSFDKGVIQSSAMIEAQRAFSYDGKNVRFCQVMGVDADKIISNKEKHKYTEIAIIPAQPLEIKEVHMSVTDKDKVQCWVMDVDGETQPPVETVVCDSDIMACNDEQYTFFVKQS